MSEKMDVNLTGVKQSKGVWLVKVPKYLAQQWDKATEKGEVGKITIGKKHGKTEVHFSLSEELAAVGEKDASLKVPRDHPFTMHAVGGQTLAVFSQRDKDEISLEGMVVHRAECRPVVNDNYMKLKNWREPSLLSSSLWPTTISMWSMRRRRSQRGRWCELSGRWCWTCFSLLSRNTSTTTLRTWWTSPSNL
ncbi:general transcription factor IIF subunit 2-like [Scomber scombrus]|uniref:General transcription factor IIF subunit 2 n=1 Tax=Scomber scombrus TaxID=13677 RepID=A0AAV1P7I9_SCOSC